MTHRDIRFLSSRVLHGPNRWTWRSVLEVVIDIGELEDCPSNVLPGYPERLVSLLPSLWTHRCSIGEPGGFIQRLQQGTWPCHILEHITLELQNLAGLPGGFGRARETETRGVYVVVVSCRAEAVTRQALADARELILAAMAGQAFDVSAVIRRLETLVEQHWLPGWMTDALLAAESLEIPWRRSDGAFRRLELGQGRHARILWQGGTDRTGAIASGITDDLELCNGLLTAAGIRTATTTASADIAAGEADSRRYIVIGQQVLTGDGMSAVADESSALLRLAARVIGLDVVTLVTTAASTPGDPVILRLMPGVHPAAGTPRPIDSHTLLGETLVRHLFASPASARACLVGITTSHPHATLTDGLQRQLIALGLTVGDPARQDTDATVITRHARDILQQGMGYDRCRIGIVTDMPDPASLDDPWVTTTEKLSSVLRCQVDVVLASGTVILAADDTAVLDLARHCKGRVLFFSEKGLTERTSITALLDGEHRALVQIRDGQLVLLTHSTETVVITSDSLPSDWISGPRRHTLLVLAATGLALSLSTEQLLDTLTDTLSSATPPGDSP